MKICVIIPSHNEGKTVFNLIKRIQEYRFDVIVIDDGSTDDTADQARQAGVMLLKHETNKGKGLSLREGFDFALQNNYDGVITMDGDGQHDPENIADIMNILSASKQDVIIGNRMMKTKNMPFIRFLTNKFMSSILSRLCNQDIPDSQCGFRFISTDVLKTISLSSSNFEIESEVLIAASRKKFKIESVPIKTIYKDEKSKISPFVDTVRFINFIIRHSWAYRS